MLVSTQRPISNIIWRCLCRYSSKYKKTKARLRELGLLDSNYGSIFQLDAWEVPREAIILNRKLGEGAFGAVFGGEALGFTDQEGSTSVAVKTLKVGASTEDKVSIHFSLPSVSPCV